MNTTEPTSTTPATAISAQRITLSLITMLMPAKNSTTVSNVTDSSKSSPFSFASPASSKKPCDARLASSPLEEEAVEHQDARVNAGWSASLTSTWLPASAWSG